jgi:hypothetical protein
MDEIEVVIDWSRVNTARLGRQMMRRFRGPWVLPLAFVAAAATWIGQIWLIGWERFGDGVPVLFAFFAAALVAVTPGLVTQRRFHRAVAASAIRQAPGKVVLDAEGIHSDRSIRRAFVPWSWVTDTIETGDCLFLMMSPADHVPLPDAGLPAELDRAGLKARIAAWREAAA